MAGQEAGKAVQTGPVRRRSPMEHPRHQYPSETAALLEILRGFQLTETLKWGKPCFTLGGKNIVLVQRFKHYLALLFVKGALLHDPGHLLSRVGEHTVAARQLRFASVDDVLRLEPALRAFLQGAIAVEKAGATVAKRPSSVLEIPAELQAALDADPALRKAFAALTPGRQKGYLLQIAAARQASTRAARVQKFAPAILAGKGLHDAHTEVSS